MSALITLVWLGIFGALCVPAARWLNAPLREEPARDSVRLRATVLAWTPVLVGVCAVIALLAVLR